jgi:lipopolysaccharide export system permease protein
MLTIDRYILRLYIKVLVVCFFSLTGLFIVIDLFGHLDELLAVADQQGSLRALLCEYYGARSLAFFDRTSALMALVAATFAVTTLQRSNELAALMAGGIPKIRVVSPLIGGTVVVALLAAANRELAIPSFRDKLMRNSQDWDGQAKKELEPRWDNRTDILLLGSHTMAAEQRIAQPRFRLPTGMGRFSGELSAESAYYREPESGRPQGYLMDKVNEPADLDEIPSVYVNGEPVVLSPSDTLWLESDQCFVVSNVTFEQLAAGNALRQYSSTLELISGLHNSSFDYAADVRVAVHARLVQPFLDCTLLLLGLPLVLSRENRNIFVAAGLCILVVAGFILVVMACHYLGNRYLIAPSLAAWCPLLILVPIARVTSQAFWQ